MSKERVLQRVGAATAKLREPKHVQVRGQTWLDHGSRQAIGTVGRFCSRIIYLPIGVAMPDIEPRYTKDAR